MNFARLVSALGVFLVLPASGPIGDAAAQTMATANIEPPFLVERVARRELMPVAYRLPDPPAVAAFDRPDMVPGQYGGQLRILMSRANDVRMMVVYGYARLVTWTHDFRLVPDIAEKVDVKDDRIFTFTLREGHRWSDGELFTAEDFRYWWEDVANNPQLSPLGPPVEMKVRGNLPVFEVLNERTVRFRWDAPNPDFLPALAGAAPLYIYRPAHYLKRFHARYTDPARLAERVARAKQRNWAALHNRLDSQYRNDNPSMPTLQPWVIQTRPPAQRFVFNRNPYFHRVDGYGRQLPYIDQIIMNIADAKIVPAKTGAGEADLQARGLNFSDYTFLKRGEKMHGFRVLLWHTAKGSQFALYPNLNSRDPVWQTLFRDARVRQALSLAVDRHEINQAVYFGLAAKGGDTVLAASPLHRPEYQQAWAQFDLARANALLDAVRLTRRSSGGIRLLPDGRPMEIVVETAGEDTQQIDVLELIRDSWLRIGIKLHSRPSQRELFRNRIFSGDTIMSVWTGLENGLPNPDMSPAELAPTSQQQLQWPKWGQHFETGGHAGEPPADLHAIELLELYRAWRATASTDERRRIWHRMLALRAEQVFTIGIVAGVPQPVVVSTALRNVPAVGVYNWEPGAFFGIWRPDLFWFAEKPAAATPPQRAAR